eukprot:COSAG01_NODE_14389_length_1460_cov_6.049229_2_plen_104_part_00
MRTSGTVFLARIARIGLSDKVAHRMCFSEAIKCFRTLRGGSCPPSKLFLAPAKDGGAPPDACGAGDAAAPSEASPSTLAGGRRMGAGKGGQREGCLLSTREMH